MNNKEWYTDIDEHYDTNTVTLAELIDMGFFDWDVKLFNWTAAAYDQEQHDRVCQMFVDRFYWREIGVVPPLKWAQILMHKLRNEVMPKYRPLYAKTAEGVNWFAESDAYGKSREIDSGFPETMLSGNEVYASSGKDAEFENVTEKPTLKAYNEFSETYASIDEKVLDELECMFTGLWATNVNGW